VAEALSVEDHATIGGIEFFAAAPTIDGIIRILRIHPFVL
jgi:hypothetical protein